MNYVKSKHPEVLQALKSTLKYLEVRLKDTDSQMLAEELDQAGFHERLLLNKLIDLVNILLKPYKDAQFLRNLDTSEYRKFINTVITDIFVDRKYSSSKRLLKEFATDQTEECKRALPLIHFLMTSLYLNNTSFETLEIYMEQRLNMSKDKIEDFIRAMEKNKDALERYFLFEQLSKLRQTVNELAASVETEPDLEE